MVKRGLIIVLVLFLLVFSTGVYAVSTASIDDEFKKLGVDEVICLSVNDAYVMFQWSKHQNATKVKMLPDGSALFSKGMGMLVKKDDLGFGERSWRYSMYVEDGNIKKMFIESGFSDNCPDDPFKVSDAQTMLKYLKSPKK